MASIPGTADGWRVFSIMRDNAQAFDSLARTTARTPQHIRFNSRGSRDPAVFSISRHVRMVFRSMFIGNRDLKHASRFDQIEAAARALGGHVDVSVQFGGTGSARGRDGEPKKEIKVEKP